MKIGAEVGLLTRASRTITYPARAQVAAEPKAVHMSQNDQSCQNLQPMTTTSDLTQSHATHPDTTFLKGRISVEI